MLLGVESAARVSLAAPGQEFVLLLLPATIRKAEVTVDVCRAAGASSTWWPRREQRESSFARQANARTGVMEPDNKRLIFPLALISPFKLEASSGPRAERTRPEGVHGAGAAPAATLKGCARF